MIRSPTGSIDQDSSAQAFEELRGEVSLTRRAVEGLTAARERVPDYSETLGAMSEALSAALDLLERIERSPAVRLSPEAIAAELFKASAAARVEDVRLIHEARDVFTRSIGRVDGIVERGQAADRQLRQRLWGAGGGAVAGMLIWAVLPGAVARALPASWHVPEWMAERTLGRIIPKQAVRYAMLLGRPSALKRSGGGLTANQRSELVGGRLNGSIWLDGLW